MNNIVIALIIVAIIASMMVPIFANKRERFTHYAIERPQNYFEEILKKHVVDIKSSSELVASKPPLVLNKLEGFIASLFKEYEIIESEIVNTFLDTKKYNYFVTSKILLHRQDKMTGILISLGTIHDLELTTFQLIQYQVSLISQDKFALKSNNIGITMQEYGQDAPITKSSEYENTFLKQHYADIKKYRGITIE